MKFTVLVMTYNSELPKLYLTLLSAVRQRIDEFEIVVTDDGSRDNHFREIEAFFKYHGFTAYELVGHEKNQGTVKNLISGLSYCTGKYVKFIGAGDALYDENTLERVYEWMEKKRCACCFGLLQGFRMNGTRQVELVDFCHPFDIEAYRKGKEKKIRKNLVLYSDNVCGAAICYRRDYAVEYMEKMASHVVYMEDMFQVLAAVEGRRVKLYDNYIVWYEVGSGSTTKKRSEFQKLIQRDTEQFYKWLCRKYESDIYVRKRRGLMKLYKIQNIYLRTLIRFFRNPNALCYFIGSIVQRMGKKHGKPVRTAGFLDHKEFLEAGAIRL